MRSSRRGLPLVLLGAALAAPAASPASAAPPVPTSAPPTALAPAPGASTLDDPFYPTLGNGGYDTLATDLAIRWSRPDPAHPQGRADVDTTIEARATQDLSSLSLDLAGPETAVASVTVDGVPATWSFDRLARKLRVLLPRAVARDGSLRLRIRSSTTPSTVARTGEDQGLPAGDGTQAARAAVAEGRGVIADGAGGMLLAAQPNGAHLLFPVNDHPLDKARYRVTITSPPGMVGVASGALERLVADTDGSLTTTWASERPLASHVLSLAVGDLVLHAGRSPSGVAMRHAISAAIDAAAGPLLAEVPGILDWLARSIGVPYPFETFGLLVYDGRPTEAVLEGQTLVLVPGRLLAPWASRCGTLGLAAHEAAHQWFGDWVSVARWDEKWLSEGHATWWEWRWLDAHGCLPVGLETRLRRAYEAAATVRATHGPPGAPRDAAALYSAAIYEQGALALAALEHEVGDAAFAHIERTLLERFGGGSATTADLVALASEVSGRDLGPFLDAWLLSDDVPPMPGRPDLSSARPGPGQPSASPVGSAQR